MFINWSNCNLSMARVFVQGCKYFAISMGVNKIVHTKKVVTVFHGSLVELLVV